MCTSSSCTRKTPTTTLAQLWIDFLVLTTWVHTGHRHGFRFFLIFFDFCTRDTLLQKTDKIHNTGSKSGSYHYKDFFFESVLFLSPHRYEILLKPKFFWKWCFFDQHQEPLKSVQPFERILRALFISQCPYKFSFFLDLRNASNRFRLFSRDFRLYGFFFPGSTCFLSLASPRNLPSWVKYSGKFERFGKEFRWTKFRAVERVTCPDCHISLFFSTTRVDASRVDVSNIKNGELNSCELGVFRF